MKRSAVVIVLVVFLTLATVALALSLYGGAGTLSVGGGPMVGGSFRAETTIGQVVAGGPMEGGEYRVTSGYWASAQQPSTTVYLPTLVRQ